MGGFYKPIPLQGNCFGIWHLMQQTVCEDTTGVEAGGGWGGVGRR